MQRHLHQLKILAASALISIAAGCVWVTEIALELDTDSNTTLEQSMQSVETLLHSISPSLIDSTSLRWQDQDNGAVATNVCRTAFDSKCLFAGIQKSPVRVRLTIYGANPKGCFKPPDYEWAQQVLAEVLSLTDKRARVIKDSGPCKA